MSKNLIIGMMMVGAIGILGLVVLGSRPVNDDSENVSVSDSEEQEVVSQNQDISTDGKTLEDFMKGDLGDKIKCEFSYVVGEDNRLDGVTYIAEQKVRVDYELEDPVNGQRDLHMISDGEYGYVWGDSFLGEKMQGTKYRIDFEEEGSDEAQSTEMIDYEVPLIKCEPWNPENDLFKIPEDVSFMDIEDLQGSAINMNGMDVSGAGIASCEICNQLPEGQRNNCLEDMGCIME